MYVMGKGHEHEGPGTSMVQMVHGGLGCAGCGGGCGCGMGLFESGMDFTSWTWKEWFAVGIGGYVLTSMFFTTRRAARQVREGVSGRVKRTRRRIARRIEGRE